MVGKTVSALINKNNSPDAFRAHTDAIELAQEADDHATADLLKKILKLEESSTDWAEIQRVQIENKGLENYLLTQAESRVN